MRSKRDTTPEPITAPQMHYEVDRIRKLLWAILVVDIISLVWALC